MNIPTIDPKTSKEWLDNNEAVLIDVREPVEYNQAHIAGSHLIPLNTIQAAHLEPHKNKKIIIHCKMGGRSKAACEKILSTHPQFSIYNLEGGITAWINENLPVEQGK